ncbi:uncharacterized protein HKW66_Vig0248660 [Vigna angularis]|uniref:Uncharacterized protein n=1 Tax=Phaseolus angularis TaxID=3914 RepID=A0A8T0JR13_PHAAN|nr:uncharacterized protein HKW66_Vig0248660 [Vigna angularis]
MLAVRMEMTPLGSLGSAILVFARLIHIAMIKALKHGDMFTEEQNDLIESAAEMLYGSALTPVEVLVAMHGIVPEKDGLALKKACLLLSTCMLQITLSN